MDPIYLENFQKLWNVPTEILATRPDESWTHQSFLTQMNPGLTKVFSPRWVLDSPKFSHPDESWTHQSFQILDFYNGGTSEMSSGPSKINCYKLSLFLECKPVYFTIVNSYIANINCPKWRFFNYGTQEIRTVVLVLSCFLLFPTNSFKYL